MKYVDIVGYINLGLSLPFILTKTTLTFIPVGLAVVSSKFSYKRMASMGFQIAKTSADLFNCIERYWIYLLSILMYPIGLKNWKKNQSIIKFFRNNVKRSRPSSQQIMTNIKYAIAKEGMFETYWKMIVMFSGLPSFRHSFLNNPFLFEYNLYLTNQTTQPFNNTEKMTNLIYAYITDINNIDVDLVYNQQQSIGDIGFTPNYYNDPNDNIRNYDNYGLQIGGNTSTLIYLETINKTPQQLLTAIENQMNISNSIIYKDHPIYQEIVDNNYQLIKRESVDFDTKKRFGILDLVVEYDDYYHLITGKVEANVQEGNIIEHPMLCLYHQGNQMKSIWKRIDKLFIDDVMGFLNKMEHI